MIRPKVAFIFPGQGSQLVGMCRALFEQESDAAAIFSAADRIIPGLSACCFTGPAEQLNRTEWTQPALLTAGAAVWQTLQRRGVGPDLVAGHSLGEYTALVAAGALTFESALRLVQFRARAMQEAVPQGEGAMAALLGVDEETADAICRETVAQGGGVVAPANFNGGGQIVIAGQTAAVERAASLAKSRGVRRVVMLPVSVPSHCPLMEPAGRRLGRELEKESWRELSVPLVTNVDASPVQTAAAAKSALVRQLANPVRWEASIRRLAADGVECFVEVGPGRVLTGLVRRIMKGARLFSVETPEELDAVARELSGTDRGNG